MDTIGLQEKCQIYLERGQKQWDSYFSRWEDLAQNEVGIDEDHLIDSEDEELIIDPHFKKSGCRKKNNKLFMAQKIRKKCLLTLNKKQEKNKRKENLNVEERNVALKTFKHEQITTIKNQTMRKLENDIQEEADLRMVFLETLTACANKSGIFGILSRTFSYHGKLMNDLACGSLGLDNRITPNSVNSITANITLNINSNFAGESRPLLMDKTENAVLNFSLRHNRTNETCNGPSGSQFSFPRKTSNAFGLQAGAILDSNVRNFPRPDSDFLCETPKNNFAISRNCFSENFQAKRKFSRLNFESDEDETIKRFRSSQLDFEEKIPQSPSSSKLIKSRDLISSINKKDFNFETPKSKKSLRLCSSENIGAKNKRKSKIKLLVDSDDEDEEDTWPSKSSLKILCTPKSNKKIEIDKTENSDSDECDVIFESVKRV